jgi:hypothetical protein
LLCFVTLATTDYGRLRYASVTVANCALYGADSVFAATTPYADIQAAALADATNLTPTPDVTSANGTDASGNNYIDVTVRYAFQTLVNYPWIPSSVDVRRTVRMAIAPP